MLAHHCWMSQALDPTMFFNALCKGFGTFSNLKVHVFFLCVYLMDSRNESVHSSSFNYVCVCMASRVLHVRAV